MGFKSLTDPILMSKHKSIDMIHVINLGRKHYNAQTGIFLLLLGETDVTPSKGNF